MANLTIAIDDALLRRARIRALEQGTSVNEVLRDYLSSYADSGVESAARTAIAELALAATASSGPQGRSWTRDDLHDRAS